MERNGAARHSEARLEKSGVPSCQGVGAGPAREDASSSIEDANKTHRIFLKSLDKISPDTTFLKQTDINGKLNV